MEGRWKFQGGGEGAKAKVLKKSMELNWNFWGGGGCKPKTPPWAGVDFLEPAFPLPQRFKCVYKRKL